MACGGVNVVYSSVCVIHLLQALQVCVPAVHKTTHITLHHLSLLPSKRKLNGITQPTVSAKIMLYVYEQCHCLQQVTYWRYLISQW